MKAQMMVVANSEEIAKATELANKNTDVKKVVLIPEKEYEECLWKAAHFDRLFKKN